MLLATNRSLWKVETVSTTIARKAITQRTIPNQPQIAAISFPTLAHFSPTARRNTNTFYSSPASRLDRIISYPWWGTNAANVYGRPLLLFCVFVSTNTIQ